jgi:hypothetical protein
LWHYQNTHNATLPIFKKRTTTVTWTYTIQWQFSTQIQRVVVNTFALVPGEQPLAFDIKSYKLLFDTYTITWMCDSNGIFPLQTQTVRIKDVTALCSKWRNFYLLSGQMISATVSHLTATDQL